MIMPNKPPRVCPGCRQTVSGDCPRCHAPWRGKYDRGSRNPWQGGSTKRWRRFRANYLLDHPVCERCGQQLATVVNHLPGTDYDTQRFDYDQVEALCNTCDRRQTGQAGAAARARQVHGDTRGMEGE